VRDSTEKDLGMHLENALKGAIIPERWPKSGIDVAVTVLEAEQDQGSGDRITGVALLNVLAGCINVAVAAIADSRIDCLDLLAAGVGAIIPGPKLSPVRVLDPAAAEHEELLSTCLVGFLPSRDEIVEIWSTGSVAPQGSEGNLGFDELVDSAVAAARGAQTVLKEVLLETLTRTQMETKNPISTELNDVEMKT
jgi:exosome complex component MTR3